MGVAAPSPPFWGHPFRAVVCSVLMLRLLGDWEQVCTRRWMNARVTPRHYRPSTPHEQNCIRYASYVHVNIISEVHLKTPYLSSEVRRHFPALFYGQHRNRAGRLKSYRLEQRSRI